MTAPKAGYKGAVYIGAQKIGGGTSWGYSGETRNMADIDEFGDENIFQEPLQIAGGDVSISGHLKMADVGQILLETRLADAAEITDLKLYIDKTGNKYFTPDPAITSDGIASHCIVTAAKVVGDEKSGIGTFSATLHVNGTLKRV